MIEGTLQSQLGYSTLPGGKMRYVNPNNGCHAAYLACAIAIHQCLDDDLVPSRVHNRDAQRRSVELRLDVVRPFDTFAHGQNMRRYSRIGQNEIED